MKALYLENNSLTVRNDYPDPDLQPGDALLRVNLAGICSTDLELVKGYGVGFTGVLGHEFVGEVIAAADAHWIGQRVVSSINIGCGKCYWCLGNVPEHCEWRQTIGIHDRDGAFADYIAVPIANLHPVPDKVPDEAAVFTEPLAAALRIREQVVVRPSAKTAVIGPGRLGMLVGLVMALSGSDVTMLGRQTSSLRLPEKMGLKTGLSADFPENSFDLIVEVTGNQAGFAEGLRLIRPLGTIILKSTFHGHSNLNMTKIVVDEISVIGSRCGPFAPALRLLAHKQIDVHSLIDKVYSLSKGMDAIDYAANPGIRKVLLKP
jgi:threonine dehydrogenase-like Zn-dependent dehydrogenase